MAERDTFTLLAEELALVFEPLKFAVKSPEDFREFMRDLGWDLSLIPAPINSLGSRVKKLLELLDDVQVDGNDIMPLVAAINSLVTDIRNLENMNNGELPGTVDATEFKNEFPAQVLQALTVDYLAGRHGQIEMLLKCLGIIRIEEVKESGKRLAYLKKEFAWEDIGIFFNDPTAIFTNAYKWGAAEFRDDYFFQNLYKLLENYGLDVRQELLHPNMQKHLAENATNPDEVNPLALKWFLWEDKTSSVVTQTGLAMQTLPQTGGELPGFSVIPFANASIEEEIELTDSVKLLLELGFDVSAGLAILIRPSGVKIETGIIPDNPQPPPSGLRLSAGIQYQNSDGKPTMVFGVPEASRLEFQSASVKIGGAVLSNGEHEIFVEMDLKSGKLVIKLGGADGFLKNIMPESGIEGSFDLALVWSSRHGVNIKGGGGLEIELPTHVSIGPVELNGLQIGINPSSEGIPIHLSTSIAANLGPLVAVVERMGIVTNFEFAENDSGNLGPLDFSMGFKPPNGVGLSIDAGVVKGGGFVKFYPEKGEYSGFLELTFSEIVSLKAIGIINTKMPDGSDGFSLLVIISAEFGSGIQLGFGFTLLGVGGLLGLNRTMKLEALATGVRTGAVNGIMFPTNIIENAPRIISDLQDFFPVQQDRFLIGPMAKLGWGTPTLISISLGIIIEIPGNIAILGILKIVLPTEEASLIKLQVNFIGAIEFDKERLWFFASMYDSRVLFYTLEGEMGLLVGWGAKANFVSSVGGFHPAFKPPPLPFPSPTRISLSILNESWGKIRVMAYFAVTSNTAQFGAKAELYFGFSEFKIEGHIGFDALFQFSPFYMIIQLSASLSVKVFGIGLFSVRVKMSLEGPAPWYAHGTGSISLLFFDIDVDFDFSWGEEKDTTLPPISIMPLLVAEFEKQENWKALVPANNNLLVSLRELDSVAELVLHPVGTLQVIQRAIPLELTLDKMGSQKPDDANFFSLEAGGSELEKIKSLNEDFAIAQFKELKDAEKLSSPAFQPIEGGMELSVSGEQLKTGRTVKRHIRYELNTVDTNYKRGRKAFFNFFKTLFGVFLRGNTVARADISYQTRRNLQPFDTGIQVNERGFSVAKTSNNTVFDTKAHFSSQAQAKEYMQAQLRVNPQLEGELHVLPHNEINPAA